MAKVTFIGAGGAVFAAQPARRHPRPARSCASSEITLYDIDADRLATSELVAAPRPAALDAPAKVVATTDRRAALDGADFVINMIQVGGYEPCTVTDFEVPKKYGLRQTIADTLGIGGILRALRTIPVLLSCAPTWRSSARTCGSSTTRTRWRSTAAPSRRAERYPHRRPVPQRARDRARALRSTSASRIASSTTSRPGSTTWRSTCSSSTTASTSTRNSRRSRQSGRIPDGNRVRYEMLQRFGYFVTESSEHFAEYVPWFINRDAARPDRALQHPPRRVPAALRGTRSRAGKPSASGSSGASSSRSSPASSTARRSSAASSPASRASSTATCPTTT